MFHHVKELQFNARVSGPDPRFAKLLLEQFGGPNGELKAAMQYFVQAFLCRHAYPDKYDLLMDVATEEFSHLEIVGATITMLLNGVNGELKNAAEQSDLMKMMNGKAAKEDVAHEAYTESALSGAERWRPVVTDSAGNPWSGHFVNANGDLTVDLRSNIAAEGRAKIVYEYLLQFTDDPLVQESLRFLMTREIAHSQMFSRRWRTSAELPAGHSAGRPPVHARVLQHVGWRECTRAWNQGQGPWPDGEQWVYIDDPHRHVVETRGQLDQKNVANISEKDLRGVEQMLSKERSAQVKTAAPPGEAQWTKYPTQDLQPPMKVQK
jgi:Mn-containing catalase